MGSIREVQGTDVDVLLVGAGFASFTLLNRLRKLGLSIRIYEKGSASGGIWHWNCYPGARVDTEVPIYQLYDKELWQNFTFTEKYPDGPELQRYFEYVEKKWDIHPHISYNKQVEGAHFDEKLNQWSIECSDGSLTHCRWFIPCIGFASKHYTPPFPGIENFKGEVYHTAKWPQKGVNLAGKRVAQIGTGATGIQLAQEIGDQVKHLTLYLRTPNYCLPMRQCKLDHNEEQRKKESGEYQKRIADTRTTFTGFTYDFIARNTFDDTPEQREQFYQSLFDQGGFRFWLNNYKDLLFNQAANDEAYRFWRKSVLARIRDPEKQRLLAPEIPPHPWGTKRPSLEQHFYETIDQDHIDIINVNENPIDSVAESGLVTRNSGLAEVDVLILATGFDAVTGSLSQLDIRGIKGENIAQHWRNGLRTAMGIALPEFPNMFFLYGPQAPTALSNGPSCTQFQAEFVEEAIKRALADGVVRLEAKQETEDEWCKKLHAAWDATLFPLAKSWYSGSNIPGKRVEPLNWAGGMVQYCDALYQSLEDGYQGWHATKA